MQLTTLDIKRIRQLRYQDGLSAHATAKHIGCSMHTVWRYAPGRPGKIPNDKLRAAFLESNVTAAELCRQVGWTYQCDGRDKANSAALKRTLGILSSRNPSGGRCYRHMIDAEMASVLAEALGLMAWEIMPDEERIAA